MLLNRYSPPIPLRGQITTAAWTVVAQKRAGTVLIETLQNHRLCPGNPIGAVVSANQESGTDQITIFSQVSPCERLELAENYRDLVASCFGGATNRW